MERIISEGFSIPYFGGTPGGSVATTRRRGDAATKRPPDSATPLLTDPLFSREGMPLTLAALAAAPAALKLFPFLG